jgi:hypothetical protein
MENYNYGEEDSQLLKNFRKIGKSYIEVFKNTRDHIRNLLGSNYNYHSGIFREGLIRDFLSKIMPTSVSIDTGFIYGFDEIDNSKQIDILIWDASKYSPIYRTKEFVIVPPDSVIAAIEVKTILKKEDLIKGLENLLSITKLDIEFREKWIDENKRPILPPIGKYLISYQGSSDANLSLSEISEFYTNLFSKSEYYNKELIPSLQRIDPFHPQQDEKDKLDRLFPKCIAAIEDENISFYRGWGPPEDIFAQKTFGPDLRRLPYFYKQDTKFTQPFEKFVSYLLEDAYRFLGTKGFSTMLAWRDLNPLTGSRIGDVDEVIESVGQRLIDPEKLNYKTIV